MERTFRRRREFPAQIPAKWGPGAQHWGGAGIPDSFARRKALRRCHHSRLICSRPRPRRGSAHRWRAGCTCTRGSGGDLPAPRYLPAAPPRRWSGSFQGDHCRALTVAQVVLAAIAVPTSSIRLALVRMASSVSSGRSEHQGKRFLIPHKPSAAAVLLGGVGAEGGSFATAGKEEQHKTAVIAGNDPCSARFRPRPCPAVRDEDAHLRYLAVLNSARRTLYTCCLSVKNSASLFQVSAAG